MGDELNISDHRYETHGARNLPRMVMLINFPLAASVDCEKFV
jgi:hypothetical protein